MTAVERLDEMEKYARRYNRQDALTLVAALRAGRRVIDEAIEDAVSARASKMPSGEGYKRSDILVRVLRTLRDSQDDAITTALDPS
jgi:hypothetical protein